MATPALCATAWLGFAIGCWPTVHPAETMTVMGRVTLDEGGAAG
jgi:hypothetical protein